MKSEFFSWIKAFVIAFAIVLIVRMFIFSPTTVLGSSMSPTFENGNRVIVSKISEIQRFDMVVFDAPNDSEKYIKRVIGLPGDAVEMKDDLLYVNGEQYDEPYLQPHRNTSLFGRLTGDFSLEELTGETIVPDGYFFVLGDNRLYSKDSGYFGFISEDALLGKVVLQFYPFNEMKITK